MAEERRIFPTETVLELVAGKKDADTGELVRFLLGRPLSNPASAKAAAPFAAAWLARWFPKFMDLDRKEDDDWSSFVSRAKARLGANLSLSPMSGRLKVFADEIMDMLRESHESLVRQTEEATKLRQQVKNLAELQDNIKALQGKKSELEEKLQATKKEAAALQRKVCEYEGKIPLDRDELLCAISSAIRDGLKGVAINGGAPAAMPTREAEPVPEETSPEKEQWGFKSSYKKKNDW